MSNDSSFTLFPYLAEDVKQSIVSFVTDAPFESNHADPHSNLTHVLPFVSRRFWHYCELDAYWHDAVIRQVRKEPFLWKAALTKIIVMSTHNFNVKKIRKLTVPNLVATAYEAWKQRAQQERSHSQTSYKAYYQHIVSAHLRFCGPVFYMSGQIQLGEPYGLHFFEPRYRILIATLLANLPDTCRNSGRIPDTCNALFIHANRDLAPASPATLVRVVSCQMYPDGRADVILVPEAHVWLERLWVQPHSGHLYHAQCLRMPSAVSMEMNQLARQEMLTSVMLRMAGDVLENQRGQYLGNDTTDEGTTGLSGASSGWTGQEDDDSDDESVESDGSTHGRS